MENRSFVGTKSIDASFSRTCKKTERNCLIGETAVALYLEQGHGTAQLIFHQQPLIQNFLMELSVSTERERRSSISIDQTSGSGYRRRSIWYLNEVISVGNYDNHLITVLVLRFMNDICNFYLCNFTFVRTIIHDCHLKLYLPCHVLNYLSNILSYE